MSLATRDELTAFARGHLTGADTEVLDRVLLAAERWVQLETNWIYEVVTARTTFLDGDRALGRNREILRLPVKHRRVLYDPGTYEVVVTENGEALTVTTGYTTTADVQLVNANAERTLELVRRATSNDSLLSSQGTVPAGWARGYQNIAVTYQSGWLEADIPDDVKHVVLEVALLLYSSPKRTAKASGSTKGRSVTISDALSTYAQRVIELRKGSV
jgi:hypothetical protein